MFNPFSLAGKTILITGASSGIGKETAIRCAKMGARLILTARNVERLKGVLTGLEGDGHQMIVCDLNVSEQLNQLIGQIDSVNGVLISVGKGLTSPYTFTTKDKYEDVFNINFFSPIELLRLLVKKKKLQKESSVVIISSISGTAYYNGCNVAYGTSKAALNSVMKYCAIEFAPKKIRVNSICPGMIDTPLIHRETISEEQLQQDVCSYPLKRYGKPEDVANGAIYLLSDASSWVTGHSLVIDGGKTI